MTMLRSAEISEDGQYRYALNRRWDEARPVLPWICLNPSTADATVDDPSVRRMCWFSLREGYGGICVLNLYALRTPVPADLRRHPDPVGPDNDRRLKGLAEDRLLAVAAGEPGIVAAAWGAHALATARAPAVCAILAGVPLACLGITIDGAPRHPLYRPGKTPLVSWTPPEED